MENRILQSKLCLPDPPGNAIERSRLLRIVAEAKEAVLILLVAPAGYGKTTLAQQILGSRRASVGAWYHLEPSDANLNRYLRYLAQALHRMLPALDSLAFEDDAEHAIDDICYAIEQYTGPPIVPVLDNWETVDGEPSIAAIPPALAQSGRGKLTVIVTSRVSPSFRTKRDQARGAVLRIDAEQLAFSLPECQEAISNRLGRDIDDESAEEFWRATSGWCVSVGLLSQSARISQIGGGGEGQLAPGRSGDLPEYIREELLSNLSPRLVTFLCETSLFEVLTVERCSAVCPSPQEARFYLSQVECSAIPHVVMGQRGNYRLHALVRQVLQAQLRETVTPDRLAELHRLTAHRYLAENLGFEATELLMELGDYDEALRLMDTQWSELYGQHGWKRVRQWLERLPDEYQDRPAYIKTYSNVLNVSGDNRAAIAFLKDKLVPELFADDIESFGSLWANYWWARINTEPGPHYLSVKVAHDELVAAGWNFSPTMFGIFQNTLGMAAHLELRLREALGHVRRAIQLIEEPYARLKVIGRQNEALYLHLLGDSGGALEILRQTHQECRQQGLLPQLPKVYMLEANIHLAMGRYSVALNDIEGCIAALRESGSYSLIFDAYIGRFRGLALWFLGDRNEGLRLLTTARGAAQDFGVLTGLEVALLVDYCHLLEERKGSLAGEHDLPAYPSECQFMFLALQALRASESGNRPALRNHARHILDLATAHELPQWRVTGSFLLAMSLRQRKDRVRQHELLQEGLSTLQRIGWHSWPMVSDKIAAFVIAKAICSGIPSDLIEPLLVSEHGIDLTPAFTDELGAVNLCEDERIRLWKAATRLSVRGLSALLKKHAARPSERERAALSAYREFIERDTLPPLRLETLGGFSVSAGGRVVRFTRASSRRLLQMLLVAHPRHVHEEELIEQLWPGRDPEKGRANLRTSIKDLRRALDSYAMPRGSSYVTYAEQHYGLDLPTGSHLDFVEFTNRTETCIRQLSGPRTAIADSVSALRSSLSLYRGPLLPMLPYEPFTIELRERLHARFQEVSLKLAEMLIGSRSLQEAASVIERALAYDPLWTDGVRMLLRVHLMAGATLKAMRLYRGYEKRLLDELGLSPDEHIRAFFEQIMRSPAP